MPQLQLRWAHSIFVVSCDLTWWQNEPRPFIQGIRGRCGGIQVNCWITRLCCHFCNRSQLQSRSVRSAVVDSRQVSCEAS